MLLEVVNNDLIFVLTGRLEAGTKGEMYSPTTSQVSFA